MGRPKLPGGSVSAFRRRRLPGRQGEQRRPMRRAAAAGSHSLPFAKDSVPSAADLLSEP